MELANDRRDQGGRDQGYVLWKAGSCVGEIVKKWKLDIARGRDGAAGLRGLH